MPNPTELVAEAWSLLESGKRQDAVPLLRTALNVIDPDADKPPTESGRRVVSRTDPRRWWPNVAEAARALGAASRTSLILAIDRGGAYKGVYLRYEDTPEIQCPPVQTGKEQAVLFQGTSYPSIRAAATAHDDGRSYRARHEWVRRNCERLDTRPHIQPGGQSVEELEQAAAREPSPKEANDP